MKKNKMMRIAAVLLVVTLLSTCAISGTFAKYVTKAEGEDSARVAKWGVVLTLNAGDAFASTYETTDTEGYTGLSVEASDDYKVVAPGTSSDEVGGNIVATVKGTPEVATRYTLHVTGLKDVKLPAGSYTDYTNLVKDANGEYGYNDEFTLAQDYTPVKWNFAVAKGSTSYNLVDVAQGLGKDFPGFSLTDASTIMSTERYMNALLPILQNMVSGAKNAKVTATADGFDVSMDFEPNKDYDFTFTLSWAWDFDDNGAGTNDKADTYLGNIAAGVVNAPDGASTDIAAVITASATQID